MADLEERLGAVEERLDGIERHLDDLLRIMLSRKKLTPEQVRAIRRKAAAFARADKLVGKGRGAVSSQEIKDRLEREKTK